MKLEEKIAYSVSGRNRRKKFDFFMEQFAPTQSTKLLDIGASEEEYSETDNLIEKFYPYQHNLTALGIEDFNKFRYRYPEVIVHNYDGRHFPFPDNAFDICWTNAVIEHVGDFERQVLFLKEINRVANNAFVTTPNKYFPIEVHTRTPFLHFLPKRIFDNYLRLTGKEWATGDYMFVRSYSEIVKMLKLAGIKHFVIKKNRFLFSTLDFVIMFGEKFQNGSDSQKVRSLSKDRVNTQYEKN